MEVKEGLYLSPTNNLILAVKHQSSEVAAEDKTAYTLYRSEDTNFRICTVTPTSFEYLFNGWDFIGEF